MLQNIPHAIGHALQGIRPGIGKTVYHDERLAAVPATIEVTSHAFLDGDPLDPRFTADGAGVSPPLEWRGIPDGTAEVVVIVEDADSPTPQPLVHAIVHRVAGRDGGIAEGAISSGRPGLDLGRNSYLRSGWLPADPPNGHGVHRYLFQVYALRAATGLGDNPGRGSVSDALASLAIARGVLCATYQRV